MSTISKLAGKQFATARQKRKDAIAFYGKLRRTPGFAGIIAAGMWQTLKRIHRDPTLNGPQKEAEFRRLLQMHAKANMGKQQTNAEKVAACDVEQAGFNPGTRGYL